MGEHKVNSKLKKENRLLYINHLLDDLKSLAYMLENNRIESDVIRLGAEQEFCLVDQSWRPAPKAAAILKSLKDKHFTTELAKYNIEINLDPFEVKTSVFKKLKTQLHNLVDKVHQIAATHNSKVILSGILPSISMNEIQLDYMTPEPRYYALNEMLIKSRGDDIKIQLYGVDELAISHDSVMLEACNTSFQMHLQIKPEEFESKYNWAQAISGPVLAASVNSPLLLGKELWSETRIALFQQSMDTRKLTRANIDQQARVSFGENWVRGSIVDHYKSELSRFPILLTKKIEESSYQSLMDGKIPQLKALNLHNGTVYRWNRPCYGVGNGKAHIRIENRYIPSGPSDEDEIANMAFWVGLMHGQSEDEIDIWKKMDFSDAKNNFIRAAKEGSEAVMNWMGKKSLVSDLISNELLPKAKKGLEKLNINSQEIAHYLGVVKQRLEVHTGSQWTIKNYRALKKNYSQDHALLTLTKGIYENQRSGKSVAEWPDIQADQHPKNQATKMGHIMSTTLITANQADSARLTVELMRWNNIHHLPVVDDQRNLVGLITWRHLDKYWEQIRLSENLLCVEDIMVKKVVTVETTTPIAVAYKRAKRLKIGCLPVLQNSKLVGIITKRDLNKIKDAPDLQ